MGSLIGPISRAARWIAGPFIDRGPKRDAPHWGMGAAPGEVHRPVLQSGWQTLDITCDDDTDLQRRLNSLYGYENDICTKTYHRSRIVAFQLLVRKLVADGVMQQYGRAMDIGCNAGFYSKMISEWGFHEVTGIDIDPQYISKANDAFRCEEPGRRVAFEIMDAMAIPKDRLYDFILCTEVIEHTGNPNAIISSILELLRPGGVAVISLPNCLSLGYLTSYVGAWLRGRISPELRDHMQFPFYRGPRLFRQKGAEVLATAGVNVMFNSPMLSLLHRAPFFNALNRLNFWTSRRWPLKCFAQFYFFVVAKSEPLATRA